MVATPIGNLKDITLRAFEVLRGADLIVCEDTRVTSKLLARHDIRKPLMSLHEHSGDTALAKIIKAVEEGKGVAYVSDAGTPGLNDPGGKLVEAAFAAGIKVEPIPGASALTAAISVCGFPMDEFVYLGFAPHKKGRQTMFTEIAADKRPCVMLESTHRIQKTLEALAGVLDERRLIFLGRELTKMHETLYRGTCREVMDQLAKTSSKGEFTLIVGPQPKR
jgi:16S rRNA (cytidine1402-2'-O)-methyltransferase